MAETGAGPQSPYAKLPDRVKPEDMITEQTTRAPGDPLGGRDPEVDFLLRNAG